MSTMTYSFFDQCSYNPMALNTIFPSEKTNSNSLYPFEGSFEDLIKSKVKKGKKVYRVLEALRKSKSSDPLPTVKKKKSLPPIKLFKHSHNKKETGSYVMGKNNLRLSNMINFHKKLIQFNRRLISKENNKQINDFKNYVSNPNMSDDEDYFSLGTSNMNISPNCSKQDNNHNSKENNYCYSVLQSNKWDMTLQDFLHNKFEKTKQLFYMNNKDKTMKNNTTLIIQDNIKGNQNRIEYKNYQKNIFMQKIKKVSLVKHKGLSSIDIKDGLEKWKI